MRAKHLVLVLFLAVFVAACSAVIGPQRTPQETRVAIVGAGLTGLVAAYELEKQGIPFVVLDQAPRTGGRVQTVRWPSGAVAEAHMEEYWERSPAVALLAELGLVDRVRDASTAHSSVRIDGKVYPRRGDGDRDEYLAGIFDRAEREAFLAWNTRTWKIYEKLEQTFFAGQPLPAELRKLTQTSLAQWVQSQRLPRKVSEWIRVTVEPEMSVAWTEVSALDGIDELRIFLDTPSGFGERNYHVPGGNRRFIEALVAKVGGGRVRTSARVTAIEQDANGVKLRVLLDDERFETVRASIAIVTVPLFALSRIQFVPPLPPKAREAIATTGFAPYVKVVVGIRPEGMALTEKKGIPTLVLLSDGPVGSIYDATEGDDLARGADRLITLLLHGNQAKRYLEMGADEVREQAFDGLEALFPRIRPHLTFAEVFPYPTAIAYWPIGAKRSRFDSLAVALRTPHGRVLVGGDTTENSHSEGAVIAGQRMGRQAIGLLDPSIR